MRDRSARPHHARYDVQLPVSYRPTAPARTGVGVGWTRDLSEGGARLELLGALPAGTALTLTLQTYRGAITARAEVVWVGTPGAEGRTLHGVEYTALRAEAQAALRAILRLRSATAGALLRRPLDVPFVCTPTGPPGRPLEGRTGDIGQQGLLVHLPEPLPVGTDVTLALRGPAGRRVEVQGRVAWVEPAPAGAPPAAIHHGIQCGGGPGGPWDGVRKLVAGWPPEAPPAGVP
jgi:hypothetical protein